MKRTTLIAQLAGLAVSVAATWAAAAAPAEPTASCGTLLGGWQVTGDDVAVSPSGRVYIADANGRKIVMFERDGTAVGEWRNSRGGFDKPVDLALAPDGTILISDLARHRVQIVDAYGNPKGSFGGFGAEPGKLNKPKGLAVAASGDVYVADVKNHRMQRLDSGGRSLAVWGEEGDAEGQFTNPYGVALSPDGTRVYVADFNNSRIQVFNPSGERLFTFGERGIAEGQMKFVYDVAVDRAGDVYVAGAYQGPLESQSGQILPPPLELGPPGGGSFGGGDAGEDPWVSGTGTGIFVLRLASDLSVIWARKLAGAPDDEKPLPVVAAAGSDRVALVWNDASAVARLVALSGSEGSPLWSEALPATIANLAGDAAGPVLAGHIVGPIAFASGELSALGPGETAIVAAYDENGGQRWGRSIAPGQARAVAVDTQGHVVVGGSYSGVFDLGVGTPSSTADEDGFLAELNGEGQALWQQSLASREPQRVRTMIPFQGDLLVGGGFANAMSSGNAFLTGGEDGFVARWSQGLAPGWLLHVSGSGPQTVTGLAEGLTPDGDRRIFVAACANEQVVAGTEVVSSARGVTVFSVMDNGSYTGNSATIEANADVVCDSNVQMAYIDNELVVAGHVPALAFERQAFLKRLRFDDLGELEDADLGTAQITGLAVTLKEIVVGGFTQPQGAGNEGFITSYGRVSLKPNAEIRFAADTVLVHAIDEFSIAAVISSNTTVSIEGVQVVPDGSTTNGFLGIFTTKLDDQDDDAIELVSLVGLGPMSPRSLVVDDDGNVVIAGELTEPVVWDGQFLDPDGLDSFVLKVARDGTRLGFEHLTGNGDATLRALASGNGGEVFAGGSFDGSLVVGEVGEIYGSGVDGMLVCVGR